MSGLVLDVWSALVLAGLVGMAAVSMWTLIPRWHGIPPTPARARWIRKALSQAQVQPGEVVVDLGAGDGRVLRIAAREFGARAVGYEIEPLHCAVAWLAALLSGVVTQVSIRNEDLYQADLTEADVVFLYLNPRFVENLRQPLRQQLPPGARVVSLDFPVEGWEPSRVDIGYLIFSYRMPPTRGSLDTYLRRHLTSSPPLDSAQVLEGPQPNAPPSPNE
jgi:SAM-dependent methyltransferase